MRNGTIVWHKYYTYYLVSNNLHYFLLIITNTYITLSRDKLIYKGNLGCLMVIGYGGDDTTSGVCLYYRAVVFNKNEFFKASRSM